jgi:hypothetical protein
MVQTPIKDNVPLFWSSMCQVKTNHYRSLAHYFLATALLDHQRKNDPSQNLLESPRTPQNLLQPHITSHNLIGTPSEYF